MKTTKALAGGVIVMGTWLVMSGMAVEPVPMALGPVKSGGSVGPATVGPDMKFCQLYDLRQFGRDGAEVGMALATTSWNVGDADLMWFASPDNRHPFIVSNMYRLKNDRFEHIGQSWVKHGFYALSNTQCGGTCRFESGHSGGNWLGMGCTDTYGSSLNAGQSGLGPRSEVNPWTGYWSYQGSVFQNNHSGHSHTGTTHRIKVHDDDLDPAMNTGATYYGEGFYCILDDVNAMNSASWKSVTVSGQRGGTWSIGMSGSGIQPTDGWALDAWPGARKTMIAQVNPPEEFVSPDGRCILAVKASDAGGGLTHYEYALLNVDMDRKVGGFSIPIPSGANVTNVGYHAVKSELEPPFTNDAWTWQVGSGAITWSTTSNPIRWGTLYNFRFDCNAAPGDTAATLAHFEVGDPAQVSGITTGPVGSNALRLVVAGSCPGTVFGTVNNATPNGMVAFIFALGTGTQTIPSQYACAGTQLGLNSSARLVGTTQADGNGNASISGPSGPAACGGVLQALDVASCSVTNVAGMP